MIIPFSFFTASLFLIAAQQTKVSRFRQYVIHDTRVAFAFTFA
jgi:hypothetical protein